MTTVKDTDIMWGTFSVQLNATGYGELITFSTHKISTLRRGQEVMFSVDSIPGMMEYVNTLVYKVTNVVVCFYDSALGVVYNVTCQR